MDRLISTAIFALWVLAWAGGQAPASDSARAYDLHQLGNSLWDADSLPAADAAFREALELRKEAKDDDGFLVTATNLGIINQILGNLTAARNYLGLVIDRAPNRKLGQAYFQLARLYARTGEVVLSDQAFRVASDHAPFSTDSISRYYLYSEWSDAFLIDRPGQAMVADSLLGLAIALVDHLGDEAGYARAFNLNRRGLARAYSGQLESAIALLEESLVLNRECCEDQDLETSQLTNLGIAYRRQGRNEDAHRVLMASHRINLALSEGLPDPYLANDFDNLSTYYLESKPDSASLYAQLAVHALLPHLGSIDDFRLPQVERFPASGHPIGPEDFEQTSETVALLTYISDWAKAEKAIADGKPVDGVYDECLAIYRIGDELIRYLFQSHEQAQTQLLWRAEARRLYAEALVAALAADKDELAFYYSEQARAQLLLDEQLKARAGASLPSEDYARLLQTRATATWTRQSTSSAQEILAASEELGRLQDSLSTIYGVYAAAQEIGLPNSDLGLLQTIPYNWTLVEYFLEPGLGGWAFVWEDGRLRVVELQIESLVPLVQQFREELTDYTTPFDPQAAYRLAELIWRPLGIESAEELVIISDGLLNDVPFEALLLEELDPEATLPYRSYPWWGKQFQAAYAYSLGWLLNQGDRASLDELLFFGPMGGVDPESGLDARLQLPLTSSLAEQLGIHFDWEVLVGTDANRSALEDRLASTSLFQLSSHAFPSTVNRPGASFLLSDSNSPHFYDFELLRHRLSADLVVLAGCDTGQGLDQPGEGIASLGRSFAYAGARSLVTSRWPIDEAATMKLLDPFYSGLADRQAKHQALASARNHYMDAQLNNKLAHPYFWAGLAYIGPPEGLPPAEVPLFWMYLLVPLLLCSIGLVLYKRSQ